MNRHWLAIVVGVLIAPNFLVHLTSAQTAADWPSYNRDLAATRFSALKQINAGNVTKLAPAWSYKLRPGPDSPPAGTMNEVTPIVVNGVMFLPAGNRVVALDPDTGAEVWRYELKTGTASQRGVAYWPGDKDNPARILFTTGHKMVALNAKTGKLDPGFGNEGEMTMDVPFAGVPTIYKNVILVGMNVFGPGEPNLHPQDEVPGGLPGDSRAYDARTGKKLWDFHAIPRARRSGPRRLEGGQLEGARRQQYVVLRDDRGREARHRLHAHGRSRRELLGRRSQRATTSSPILWLRWITRRASSNGISKPSITSFGTTICRPIRC